MRQEHPNVRCSFGCGSCVTVWVPAPRSAKNGSHGRSRSTPRGRQLRNQWPAIWPRRLHRVGCRFLGSRPAGPRRDLPTRKGRLAHHPDASYVCSKLSQRHRSDSRSSSRRHHSYRTRRQCRPRDRAPLSLLRAKRIRITDDSYGAGLTSDSATGLVTNN